MNEQKFYICKHCGNLVTMMKESGVKMVCCGEEMTLLQANSTDASYEKHVPLVNVYENNNKIDVQVGSTIHPMIEQHYIEWIFVQTKKGGQFKFLKPGEDPKATFTFIDDEVICVYEHCNVHGLFKKQVKQEE